MTGKPDQICLNTGDREGGETNGRITVAMSSKTKVDAFVFPRKTYKRGDTHCYKRKININDEVISKVMKLRNVSYIFY